MDLGKDLILVSQTQQNEASYVDELSWLQLAQANKQRYGNPVWRVKDGIEYLIVQCDLTPSERDQVPHEVYSIKEYYNLKFDEPIL